MSVNDKGGEKRMDVKVIGGAVVCISTMLYGNMPMFF